MERENRPERPARDNRRRRKVCQFCVDKVACIDFKDTAKLRSTLPTAARSCPAA